MTRYSRRPVPILTSMEDRYRRARAAVVILTLLAVLFGGFTVLALSAMADRMPDAAAGDVHTVVIRDGMMHAATTYRLTPCATEDATGPCYWDAATRGNGTGQSFWVDDAGTVHYAGAGTGEAVSE